MNINDFLITAEDSSQTFTIDGSNISTVDPTAQLNTVNSDNKFVMVLDCDDLLVDISNKWYDKIKNNDNLKHYIKDDSPILELRHCYYLNEWLNIDEVHKQEFLDLYFQDDTFYDNLIPSPIMNSVLSSLEFIEEIHILTSCGSDLNLPVTKSKLKWLKTNFSDSLKGHDNKIKFHIHIIDTNYVDGKGGFLRDMGIKFNTFADDSLDNVYSVMNNVEHISKYEIIVPIYGFNSAIDPSRITRDTECRIQGVHNIHHINAETFSGMLAEMHETSHTDKIAV